MIHKIYKNESKHSAEAGSAEAHIIGGNIVKRLLIACFIDNISAPKNIKIRSHVSKL